MNDYLATGQPDDGQPYFYYAGTPDRRFPFDPTNEASIASAKQAASEFAAAVVAHRTRLAGRPLTPREAAFGPVKRDDRTAHEKTLAKIQIENFNLDPPDTRTEAERVLDRLEAEAQAERDKREKQGLSDAERRAYDQKRIVEQQQQEREQQQLLEQHLSDPTTALLIRTLEEMRDVRRFSEAFDAKDVEEIDRGLLAAKNPKWRDTGREYVKAIFQRENVRRQHEREQTRSWLKSQEQLLEEKRQQLNVEKPESQRLAEAILGGAETVENE